LEGAVEGGAVVGHALPLGAAHGADRKEQIVLKGDASGQPLHFPLEIDIVVGQADQDVQV